MAATLNNSPPAFTKLYRFGRASATFIWWLEQLSGELTQATCVVGKDNLDKESTAQAHIHVVWS